VTIGSLRRKFLVRGVAWRWLLRWGVLNIPLYAEPMVMAIMSLLFLTWRPVRIGVMANLRAIFPGMNPLRILIRTYRVLWNFAWTIADNVRYTETQTVPDWEFEGLEAFERLQSHQGGAILLTAHMGSYDLGAHLFSLRAGRNITMVRAPEPDPETRRFEQEASHRGGIRSLTVGFNTQAGGLAFDLVHAIQCGEVVAIQGDRVTPGIAASETTLFGHRTLVPTGPFALALATRVPIFPVFIIRIGRRRYRLVTDDPIFVKRDPTRAKDFSVPVQTWTAILERMVRDHWYQWYTFEPFAAEAR
jgi:phosphatidylinositol dimannoside acyltransferase